MTEAFIFIPTDWNHQGSRALSLSIHLYTVDIGYILVVL